MLKDGSKVQGVYSQNVLKYDLTKFLKIIRRKFHSNAFSWIL